MLVRNGLSLMLWKVCDVSVSWLVCFVSVVMSFGCECLKLMVEYVDIMLR